MRYKLIRQTDAGWTETGTESEDVDEIYELLEIAQKIESRERYIVLDTGDGKELEDFVAFSKGETNE